ncbi:beta-mannosidase [Pedobacter sp. HMF7647]|uniref:Mannan endo-1,4-beta-mannosidase n=1 Tax=Hufsiella arboris TaxID=2695275 RepID=A0A7K1YBE5_9SPHI|nr:glycosyl hydrolase [Hufsiella arboris]MXV51904.1 beta-mannosidase [Hufsiella arboris]
MKDFIVFVRFGLQSFLLLISPICFAQTSDKLATAETKNLLRNLKAIQGKKVLFGHQDDLAYGNGWKYEAGRSDINDVTGEYPAVYGWELGGLEHGRPVNIDSVPFDKMKAFIKLAYDKGSVTTISWHLDNPVNGKSAWDTTKNCVRGILPGASKHALYKSWLEKVAAFLGDLKGSDGKSIPVLFRPFHEMSGSWFWWGRNETSPEELKQIWRFTVTYLRDVKKLHNILYVYNYNDIKSADDFMERYPGDAYVDVMSFDFYQSGDPQKDTRFITEVQKSLSIVHGLADRHNKAFAFAETGYNAVPYAKWWTKTLWPAMQNDLPAYVLVWRNAGYRPKENDYHYFAPFKGQVSAPDFVKLYQNSKVAFEKKAAALNLYK